MFTNFDSPDLLSFLLAVNILRSFSTEFGLKKEKVRNFDASGINNKMEKKTILFQIDIKLNLSATWKKILHI